MRARLRHDRDCWLATAHPAEGPYAIPLSFIADRDTIYVFPHERRPTVRNVRQQPKVKLLFGAYGDVMIADGTCCAIHPLDDVDPGLLERYMRKAGWSPLDNEPGYVLLEIKLAAISCSRNLDEHRDRMIWRANLNQPL